MRLTVRPVQLLNYIILIGIIICLFMTPDAYVFNYDYIIARLSLISLFVVIGNFLLVKDYKLVYWDFRLYFIILNLVFIMGQVWICFFGKEEFIFWKLIYRVDTYYLIKGGIFALCSHQALVCGMFTGSQIITKGFEEHRIRQYSTTKLWNAGLCTFLLFLPFKLYYDFLYMITASASGGYLTSADIQINGYVYAFGIVSVIGLFYMISSRHLIRSAAKWLIAAISFYTLLLMVGTGDRRFAIIALLSLILCYMHSYNVKLKGKTMLFVALMAYLALIVLNVIQKTRGSDTIQGITDLLTLVWESAISLDILWESFSEYGITLMAYVYTIQYFPARFSYRLGSQILYNIVTILPLGSFLREWRLATEIQSVVNGYVSQPVGGAIATDLYGNFGLWSIIFIFLFGYLLKRIIDNRKVLLSQYECAVYFAFFCIFLNVIRAGFSEILRLAVLSYIIPKAFLMLFSSKESTKI